MVGEPIPIFLPLVPVVSPDGALVYVQSVNGPIYVVDAATRSVVRTFDDPNPTAVDGPATMTLSPDGRVLYVIGTGDAGIALVDTNTGSVSSRIPATGIASPSPLIRISHDGQTLYVLDATSAAIARWMSARAQ
jgi:DNA-binding beta-propeller fold protein YncE